MFAPGAVAMSDASLRIVLRHELFHFASRADTAADAPRWLTEGVADFVGRPPTPAARRTPLQLATIPTDADLNTAGPAGSAAYDRAWWFAGSSPTRTAPPRCGRCICGPAVPDIPTPPPPCATPSARTCRSVLARWRHWMSG